MAFELLCEIVHSYDSAKPDLGELCARLCEPAIRKGVLELLEDSLFRTKVKPRHEELRQYNAELLAGRNGRQINTYSGLLTLAITLVALGSIPEALSYWQLLNRLVLSGRFTTLAHKMLALEDRNVAGLQTLPSLFPVLCTACRNQPAVAVSLVTTDAVTSIATVGTLYATSFRAFEKTVPKGSRVPLLRNILPLTAMQDTTCLLSVLCEHEEMHSACMRDGSSKAVNLLVSMLSGPSCAIRSSAARALVSLHRPLRCHPVIHNAVPEALRVLKACRKGGCSLRYYGQGDVNSCAPGGAWDCAPHLLCLLCSVVSCDAQDDALGQKIGHALMGDLISFSVFFLQHGNQEVARPALELLVTLTGQGGSGAVLPVSVLQPLTRLMAEEVNVASDAQAGEADGALGRWPSFCLCCALMTVLVGGGAGAGTACKTLVHSGVMHSVKAALQQSHGHVVASMQTAGGAGASCDPHGTALGEGDRVALCEAHGRAVEEVSLLWCHLAVHYHALALLDAVAQADCGAYRTFVVDQKVAAVVRDLLKFGRGHPCMTWHERVVASWGLGQHQGTLPLFLLVRRMYTVVVDDPLIMRLGTDCDGSAHRNDSDCRDSNHSSASNAGSASLDTSRSSARNNRQGVRGSGDDDRNGSSGSNGSGVTSVSNDSNDSDGSSGSNGSDVTGDSNDSDGSSASNDSDVTSDGNDSVGNSGSNGSDVTSDSNDSNGSSGSNSNASIIHNVNSLVLHPTHSQLLRRLLSSTPTLEVSEDVVSCCVRGYLACCVCCGRQGGAGSMSLRRCKGCKAVWLCGRQCKERHWLVGGHRQRCGFMSEALHHMTAMSSSCTGVVRLVLQQATKLMQLEKGYSSVMVQEGVVQQVAAFLRRDDLQDADLEAAGQLLQQLLGDGHASEVLSPSCVEALLQALSSSRSTTIAANNEPYSTARSLSTISKPPSGKQSASSSVPPLLRVAAILSAVSHRAHQMQA